MKKYYIKLLYKRQYTADKARKDCDAILERQGYIGINVGIKRSCILLDNFLKFVSVCTLIYRIPKNEVLFIQMPAYNKLSKLIYIISFFRTKHIQVLIHDLQSIRTASKSAFDDEQYILQRAETIIAHTPRMKDLLVSRGIDEGKIKVLMMFDYVVNSRNQLCRNYANRVTFAGNFRKSLFLRNLNQCKEAQFVLYGAYSENIPKYENVQYAGKFESDDIRKIEGDWGLVWDGDSCESCTGLFGEYLKYIASHKLSLYIAAEMPVIVWSGSALSDYIQANNLGIVINRIEDIPIKVGQLSTSDKERIKDSVNSYSLILRSGNMLGNILKSL